jgi:hypothetical protein
MLRRDAPEKLTGQARYTADLRLPGLLHARLTLSPHASARIVSIDTTAAKAIPGVVPSFLWAAVDWGKWALVFGKTAAARQGAADRIRDYAAAVVLLDPSFEFGAGYRVLGRLHHQTPAIPFFTMWASRDEALKYLRRSVTAGPKHFYNRLYLAEAMWDYEKDKRSEARRMLEELVAAAPSSDYLVEDRRAQEDARALLSRWAK